MSDSSRSVKGTTKPAAKKKAARSGSRADKADEESAVLASIAELPEADRALGERLHALIKASAPALSPRLWYGMPAYARGGKVVCFFQKRAEVQGRDTRPSASCTRRTSTTVPCGRLPSL